MCTISDGESLESMRLDYGRIHQEILSNRTVRAATFLMTVTALGTAGFALIAMIKSSTPAMMESPTLGSDWRKWVSLGMFIPLSVVLTAIVVLLQTTRAIHLRVGYLAALGEYLSGRKSVKKKYPGWALANIIRERCNNALLGSTKKTLCGEDKIKMASCVDLANAEAKKHNDNVRLSKTFFPVRSFTSLAATVYGILLIVVGSATVFAFWRGLDMQWSANMRSETLIPIALSFASVFVLLVVYLIITVCIRMGSKRWLPLLRFGPSFIIGLGFLYAVPTSIIRLLGIWRQSWHVCFGYAFGGVCLILAGLGILLVYRVYLLRKGKYSQETYYHTWRNRFARCPFFK